MLRMQELFVGDLPSEHIEHDELLEQIEQPSMKSLHFEQLPLSTKYPVAHFEQEFALQLKQNEP